MRRPAALAGREAEWARLRAAVEREANHAGLLLISGRRRMGKTTAARGVSAATGGFHHEAAPAEHDASVDLLRRDLAAYLGTAPPAFTGWREATEVLLGLDAETVVVDGLQHVAYADPRIAELFARAYDARGAGTRARLILSGSAATGDGRPLLRHAALRERAALDLRLEGLGYRAAAAHWGITDPLVAVPMYAMLGGTPVFRDLAGEPPPDSPDGVQGFARRTVLDAGHPLFAIATRIVTDEPGPFDAGLNRIIPFTIAFGTTALDQLAAKIGRRPHDLRRRLALLHGCGLLTRSADLLGGTEWFYRINEPLFAFYHAMMRVDLGRLRRGYIHDHLWKRRAPRWSRLVLAPAFAGICRTWAREHAPAGRFGEPVERVGHGSVCPPGARELTEVDVVVLGASRDGRPRPIALGLCSWDAPVTPAMLDRLRGVRAFLAERGAHDMSGARLFLFGGAGFAPEVRTAAGAGEAHLVEPAELYGA